MNANKVILLVEDTKADEDLTIRTLRKNHIANDIVVAHDGIEAVDYLFGTGPHALRDTSVPPELVLLDVRLPSIDGLEVLARIRADERTKRVPVVVFTSSTEEDDVIRSYERGAHAFIRKPMDFAELMRAIGTMGLFWVLLGEAPRRL